ncbi:RagB/SusD family nutrient uptake outer membrane protein [Mucilaginibacter celer]|uniref:RagB/SusD family nutrient uptake outer membrane protein n=1 Tax=Mucilaginibacter celer TaxID=2305508 RepID=A0A494VY65_9SPHI|nr:RagB/SusD family nutrient uptake outer membrane protein [Mucilaginibacter celer]AYL99051.1 RagB/SusD family nutrient uptake outer membrane protein [Mucilaginibacter celer]
MKKITITTMFAALLITGACKKDSEFLDVPPKSIIASDVAFTDPALVLSILGDLYNRQVDFSGLDNGWASFADFSESFPSENGSYFFVQRTGWGFGEWGLYDYTYVRDLNLFIERVTASTALTESEKNGFIAEGRFLRANFYFEMVKRMGGVPLITKSLDYDFSGNVSSLQIPRAKESEVYDFVISEAEAIKDLATNTSDKSRASKGAILAMEARAALYAASIAKYGVTTPVVTLPGGEVGIPASMATGYYNKALTAAKAIITSGTYSLYKQLPDLSDNFANIFLDKGSSESIFVEDFKANAGKTHGFTTNDQPYSISDEGGDAGRLDPSLNLVEAFEKLDNTYAPLATKDDLGNPIYYTNQLDIFAGRDARLAGTVLLPNGLFKGKRTDVMAGYQLASGAIISSSDASQPQDVPGLGRVQVVGQDGPVSGLELRTQTGFYVRKYLDPTVGSGRRGRGSDVNFIRYRYAEVLLNAAEASAELGDYATASTYINQVRSRAGLTTPLVLTAANYFDRIVHERRVELAFEGHILFDMKRWRIAHIVWDGNPMTAAELVTNIGDAKKRNTQPFGLWPYKYYNPGNANSGKWIYKEIKPAPVTGSNRFQMGNYYSQISDDIISKNPKIVKQPNQ